MTGNAIFNATVCIIGIAILLIHIVNMIIKKNRRRDEYYLLNFLILTAIHFSTYLAFTLIKINYKSDEFIIGFYTTFYIFNNLEVFFLFLYVLSYSKINKKTETILHIGNAVLFGIFVILDIVNIFTGIFFTAESGEYIRSNTMIISQIYQFVLFGVIFIITLLNKKLLVREKTAFYIYCFLPAIAIILQNVFRGYAIAYLSILISTEILFFFINVSRNIQLAEEQEKNKEAQIKIMMSQINPHFVYNSLSSISTLISIDPKKAQQALDNFTEYLRHNISSLTETHLIHFEDELRHIETYVSLEKIRFNERIRVNYDIQVRDFYVPPLSIQPIVENAIKHGILKNIEGGTITFKTYETPKAYVVEIIDDGVGFNIDKINFSENKHFGINNIRHRLKSMCNGDLYISGEEGKGVKAVITFYKA